MKISLASKVVQDRTPEEVVHLAAQLGYGGVEWFCLPQHLPPQASSKQVEHLAELTRQHRLETVCLSTYIGGFADLDDAACWHQLQLFECYVAFARLLRCPLLRIWPDNMGRTLREPVSSATLERVATYVQRAADQAAAYGLRVGIEMHQTIGVDVQLLQELLGCVDRANVGVIYDPGNIYLAKRPYGRETVRTIGPKIFHVQLKDASLARPTPTHLRDEPALRFGGDFDLLLGEGEIDLVASLAAVRETGYAGWYSVETHAHPRPDLDSAAIAATDLLTLRRLLEQVNTSTSAG